MESHSFEMVDEAENTTDPACTADSQVSCAETSRDLALMPGDLATNSSHLVRIAPRSPGGLTRVADVAVALWRQPVVRAAVRAGTSAVMLTLAARGARAVLSERLPLSTTKRAPGYVTYAVVRETYVFRQSDPAW